jgi:urease accessory protein
LQLAAGARLEWLPLETIAYNGCDAVNRLEFDLADGAQLLAWDVTALGLPLAGQPFEHGSFTQHLQWPGRFLEHGVIAAQDRLLLDGDLGPGRAALSGQPGLASGSPLQRRSARRCWKPPTSCCNPRRKLSSPG